MTKNEFITDYILTAKGDMESALAEWKTQSKTKNDLVELVKVFRENQNMTKTDLLQMASEVSGYSLATCGHFYNAMAFAKEYHRQESV